MHQRKTHTDGLSAGGSSKNDRTSRVGRRRRKAGTKGTAVRAEKLLLPGLVILLLLAAQWIRVLFQIGTARRSERAPLFRLESEDAPRCSEAAWDSPRDIDFTLVTQLSDDRLWMMGEHCDRHGPHPVSIAVYSNKTRGDVVGELTALGCSVAGESPSGRGNPAVVSVAVLDASNHGAWNDYPVNELRNLAFSGVTTTHVVYADVDFWPGDKLYESLVAAREELWHDPKLALVVPAFQLNRAKDCQDETVECREEHAPLMPRSLDQLNEGMNKKTITVFDPYNGGGHGSTDYHRWFKQGHRVLYELPCLKSHRYEPFLAIRYCRELTPPFQSAFSGYGKNKMTWTMQVVASGFRLAQVAGAFLVHYPHAISKSRQRWNEAPPELKQAGKNNNYNVRRPRKSDGDPGFGDYHRGRVDDLYLRFKEWLAEAIPEETARMEMCRTAQDDDSKLWVDPRRKKGWK
ncbi:unnamed protein product [Pseudo-nitzschia multistriata]|uniref:Uncharacterized protein n=1 Tax=Pseudo-nitzschia multistriata TaxID=183589 RepID=A0A448YZX1_9STRA|nr:unnamed protein product [Pseudo-nitzschia multistriata]